MKRLTNAIAAALLAAGLSTPALTGAHAQSIPDAQQVDTTAIGLPVFTSDGEQIGQVVQITSYAEKPALRAEIGQFLGLGLTTAIIPSGMFDRKSDRVDLTLTASEVREVIANQR